MSGYYTEISEIGYITQIREYIIEDKQESALHIHTESPLRAVSFGRTFTNQLRLIIKKLLIPLQDGAHALHLQNFKDVSTPLFGVGMIP